MIGILAAMGFAADVAHCLDLCGETYGKGDKGATNDMMSRSMEKQGWAALLREARAAKCNARGMTQLILASQQGDLPRVLQLVQLGAPLELRCFGYTVLHFACMSGRERIIKALLDGKYEDLGADVDAFTDRGFTPLMAANMHDREGVMHLLLVRGAKVATCDNSGRTALHYTTRLKQHGRCLRADCEALLRACGETE